MKVRLYLLFFLLFTLTATYSQQGSWNRTTDFEGGDRWYGTAFSINGTGYAGFGLRYRNGGPLGDLWALDPSTDDWTQMADFEGTERSGAITIVLNEKAYLFGGTDGTPNSTNETQYNDVWSYDPLTNSWDSLSSYPGTVSSYMKGFTVGDTIYVGLGYYSPSTEFYAYHPTSGQWIQKAEFPGELANRAKAFTIDNRGFIAASDSIYEYVPTTNSWSGITDITFEMYRTHAYVIGTKVHFIKFDSDEQKTIESYDLETGEWQDEPDYGGKWAAFGTSFVAADKVYYLTGDTQVGSVNFISDTYVFDPAADLLETPGHLQASDIGVEYLTLSWTDRSDSETKFIIERYNSTDGFVAYDSVDADINTYTDTGVDPNTEYRYYVKAVNDEIDGGVYSNLVIDRTKSLPAIPDTLVASGFSRTSARLYWSDVANNEEGFIIERKNDTTEFMVIDTLDLDLTEYFDEGLDSTMTYTYRVRPYNDVGNSDYTNEASITPYYFNAGKWENTTEYPGAGFSGSLSVSVEGFGYFYGSNSNEWWRFDPQTQSWTQRSDFPGGERRNASIFAIGDSIYLGLGYVDSSVSDFWAYDTETDSWTQIEDFPANSSNRHAIGSNGKGYVLYGTTMYAYDPQTGQWTSKTDFPGTRTGPVFEIDNKLYYTLNDSNQDLWIYDTVLDSWTEGSSFPGKPRSSGTAFSFGGKGYVGTGELFPTEDFKDFWSYDPGSDSWERVESLVYTSRNTAFSIGDTAYYFDYRGFDQNFYSFVQDAPNYVTSLEAYIAVDTISLSWTEHSNDEDGFYVYRSTADTTLLISTLPADTNFYMDTSIIALEEYTYEVRAFNGNGTSSATTLTVTATDGIPFAVDDLSGTSPSETEIELTWTDASDNELGFIIQHAQHFSQITTIDTVGANVESYLHTGRTEGTYYYYYVIPYSEYGEQTNNDLIYLRTQVASPEPPSSLETSALTSTTAYITWQPIVTSDTFLLDLSTDNFSSYVAGYQDSILTNTYINIGDLHSSTDYFLRLRAVNEKGTSSYSDTLPFTTAPDTITGLTAEAISSSTIVLNWTDNQNREDGFIIRRQNEGLYNDVDTVDANVTTYTDSLLEAGAQYEYTILTYASFGVSEPSSPAYATTFPAPPSIPDGIHIRDNRLNSTDFAWGYDENAQYYQLELSDDNFETVSFTYNDIPENSVAVKRLQQESTYQIRIRAFNQGESSEYSEIFEWTTAPRMVSNVSVTQLTPYSIEVEFDDNSSIENRYEVYISTLEGDAFSSSNMLDPNTTSITIESLPAENLGIIITTLSDFGTTATPLISKTNNGNWVQLTNFQGEARQGAVSFSHNGLGYMGLGLQMFGGTNDFWSYNPDADTWTQLTDFPGAARFQINTFQIGDKFYLVGGMDDGAQSTTEVWSYTPATDSWEQQDDFPGIIFGKGGSFAINGDGYLAFAGFGTTTSNGNEVWKYDAEQDSWTQLTDFPGEGRSLTESFVIGEKAYLVAGNNNSSLKELWSYDPFCDIWLPDVELPGAAREFTTAFAIAGKGYVVAGSNGSGPLSDVWEYDPVNFEWEQKDDMAASARGFATAFVIDNLAYFGTGFSATSVEQDFWQFDPLLIDAPDKAENLAFEVINDAEVSISWEGDTVLAETFTISYSDDGSTFTDSDILEYGTSDYTLQNVEIGKNYQVFVSSTNRRGSTASDTLEFTFDEELLPTGVAIELAEGLNIFPNPVDRELQIEVVNEFDYLELIDPSGRVIFKNPINRINQAFSINVSNLRKGIYLLRASNPRQYVIRKVIKN